MNHPFETPNICWFCGQNLPSPATDCDHCSGAALPTQDQAGKALSWTDYSFGSRGPSTLEKPSATFLPDARAVFQEEPRVAIRVGDMHRAVLLLKDPENGTRVTIMKRTEASIEKKIEVETLKWEDLTYKKGMLLNYIVRKVLDLDEEYPVSRVYSNSFDPYAKCS